MIKNKNNPGFLHFECIWLIKHFRKGKLIWSIEKENVIPLEGTKAILDTLYRNEGAIYFTNTNFYVGLYKGTVSKATTLAIISGLEPTGGGYARKLCERSIAGWSELEDSTGFWRVISKEIEFKATGGTIGPVGGAFLCTAETGGVGTLFNVVAMGIERTILAGDIAIIQIKVKAK